MMKLKLSLILISLIISIYGYLRRESVLNKVLVEHDELSLCILNKDCDIGLYKMLKYFIISSYTNYTYLFNSTVKDKLIKNRLLIINKKLSQWINFGSIAKASDEHRIQLI